MAGLNASESFKFLPQGCIIQEFNVGGRNIVLGFPSAESYKSENSPYFGETIGRVSNRIAGAKIHNLNGKSYKLAANNGANTLHGGTSGFGKKTFNGPKPTSRNGRDAVEFKYVSKDGEEGFPGTIEVRAWMYPESVKDGGMDKTSLEIEYEAELVGDEVEETVVALTNHSYFNITDSPTIDGTRATVCTNLHQLTDENDVPTGEIGAFPGITPNTEVDLTNIDPDHCFIANNDPSSIPLDTRTEAMKTLVKFHHPGTNIHLEVLSTEPAFQFYTGKNLDVPAMDGMPARGPRSGLCVEASRYVNAVSDERWRGMVLLRKGQKFGSRTIYRAWKA